MLQARERKSYEVDGVVYLPKVFDLGWIQFLGDAFELALSQPGPLSEEYTPEEKTGRFFTDLNMWQRLEPFKTFIFESAAAEIASEIMQSKRINFFYDQMFVKYQQTEEHTPWHQDQPYWAVTGKQVCSVWLPLDPIEKSSSLQFVKGSHRWPAHNPHHFGDDTPYEGTGLVSFSPAGICASSCPSIATSEGPSGREHPVVELKTLTSAMDARK